MNMNMYKLNNPQRTRKHCTVFFKSKFKLKTNAKYNASFCTNCIAHQEKEKKFVLIYERLNEKENGDINPQVSG